MSEGKLTAGQQAPDFTTTDIRGNKISLQNYKDKKLMLCFFRYAGCPFCAHALLKLIVMYPELNDKGLNVVSFFQSPPETIEEYIAKFNPPFPIISDPEKKIYDLYKIPSTILAWPRSISDVPKVATTMIQKGTVQGKIDGDANMTPASFLIASPEFTIYEAHYGTTFADAFLIDEINSFLDKV